MYQETVFECWTTGSIGLWPHKLEEKREPCTLLHFLSEGNFGTLGGEMELKQAKECLQTEEAKWDLAGICIIIPKRRV